MATVNELREQLRKFQQHLQLKDNIPNWFTLRLKTLQSKNITLEDWNTTLSYLQTVVSDIVSEQEFLNILTSYLILVLNDLIRFNQLVEDVRNLERNSASAISSSQNINADGIQYTITLSNTQNATLSTITQYIPLATTLQAGLLSSADKVKLNFLESDLNTYLANSKAYTDEKLQRGNLISILGTASYTLDGLLTSEDKKKIDALYALLGEKEDADTVVNTINEVLAIFSNYPEGVDIVSQLEKKVNYSDIINTLDSEETSKPLSAKMGKELKTKVDTKAELAYVNEELDKKALKSDILVIDEAVTAQESEIETTQSEGDKLVDEIVGYVDGSPRGVYDNLSALQSAFPSGAQGVYVCSDNGHWYYWSGTAWTDGGVYQATEIADGSISFNKFDSNVNDVFEVSKSSNLLDNDNVMRNKRFRTWGNPTINDFVFDKEGSYVCKPISVDPNKQYCFIKDKSITSLYSNIGRILFKSDGSFHSEGLTDENNIYTIPADAHYIAFATNGNDFSGYNFKEYSDNVSLENEKFGYKSNRIDNIEKRMDYHKSIILINFDGCNTFIEDGRKSLLDKYQLPYTINVTINSSGNITVPNKNGVSQLLELVKDGVDIAIYSSYLRPDYSTINSNEQSDIDQWNNYVARAKELAETVGVFNATAWFCSDNRAGTALNQALIDNKIKMARGYTYGTYNPKGYLIDRNNYNNYDKAKLNMDVIGLYPSTYQNVLNAIDEAISGGYDISIFTHKIEVDAQTAETNYGITYELLDNVLSYIRNKIDNGLCEAMTYREYYKTYYNTDGQKNDYSRVIKTAVFFN